MIVALLCIAAAIGLVAWVACRGLPASWSGWGGADG